MLSAQCNGTCASRSHPSLVAHSTVGRQCFGLVMYVGLGCQECVRETIWGTVDSRPVTNCIVYSLTTGPKAV